MTPDTQHPIQRKRRFREPNTRPADRLPVEHATMSFRAWRSSPNVMPRAHTHTDIEFNLPLGGDLEYFFAGRFLRVPDGHFAVFWAGVPHRLIAREAGTEYLCMVLPLGWFLSWRVGGELAGRLLSGALISHAAPLVEREIFDRWASDFDSHGDTTGRERITLLEVEACLRRLALESPSKGASTATGGVAFGTQAERLAAHVSERYREPDLSARSVADAVGLHEKYTLTLFREACGMTLWDYVTRLRVSHAQRLLLTTDWSVERIALESGFASPGRFFAAFKTQTGGITPRQYRVRSG
ncbi:MAG: helix-turn-helix domain-containing protein [Fibrella sp.]|nr:helix-turn-helix domain-containing protein [Armatimonadota bacterium]